MNFDPKTSAGNILIPLLDALNWQGDNQKMTEAFVNQGDEMDLESLIETMANLNFRHLRLGKLKGKDIDNRFLPILLVDKNHQYLVIHMDEGHALIFDGEFGVYKQVESKTLKGEAFIFQYADNLADSLIQPQEKWFSKLVYRFRKTLLSLGLLTLLMTLLDLMLPLFVILIYDRVLSAQSMKPLLLTFVGIGIYMVSSYGLTELRARVLNYLSTRVGGIISVQTFTRLMYLSPSYTETASINSQISRIKDFEGIKNFVTSGNLISLFDLVFSSFYIAAIFLLGGWIGVIPLITLGMLVAVGFIMRPFYKLKMSKVSEATSMKQQSLIEILKNTKEVKSFGSNEHWLNRIKKTNSAQMMSNYELSNYVSLTNNISYFITNASVLVVIYAGVFQVFEGRMTTGALIGVLMLYWKVIAAIRSAFSLFVQVNGLLKSIAQINRFMKLPQDSSLKTSMTETKAIKGLVKFSEVSIRYSPTSIPALLNVSFSNEPGKILGITGHDGAGKTTILKLILGMYKPQGGRISIDNANIKQLEPLSLRKSISYSCEKDLILSGTVRDNFKSYNGTITDQKIMELADRTGLSTAFVNCGYDLDTVLDNSVISEMPLNFRKLFNLTRMLMRDSKLYLIDEPENHLDKQAITNIAEIIKELVKHNDASVIISTKNDQLLEICDSILTLNQGRAVIRA